MEISGPKRGVKGPVQKVERGDLWSAAQKWEPERKARGCDAQVVGAHQRAGDLKVNVCKKKAVTNMRASGTDNKTPLTEAMRFSLDEALEYIVDDELVEVTPTSVRIRKAPAAARKVGGKK